MRCLVIEDEAETARYICGGLQEAGYTAVVCGNGADGIHLAVNDEWEVIVLDRMLPGRIDGLSIVKTMRDLGKTTPVVILSALSGLDDRVRGLRGGGLLVLQLQCPLDQPSPRQCWLFTGDKGYLLFRLRVAPGV